VTAEELGILVVGALAGWWIISYLFDRRASRAGTTAREPPPAAPTGAADPLAAPPGPSPVVADHSAPSVLELGEQWATILGVDRIASVAQIEAAYTSRRLDLDRVRFSAAPESERMAALHELQRLEAAYGFVRTARTGEPGL
jgi:hypothetical protein